MSDPKFTNRLANETSPYLLQHAHNPVDWQPWDDESLARARDQDQPILLSIGYSACHWCHVMEHESFEDEHTARFMNEHFVCIKVDREERPDLDKIYQTAHHLLTQRPGGWPLTVALTPDDHVPFFAGTYFPKEPRYGMPGFIDVLRRVAAFYREHRADLSAHSAAVKDAFARIESDVGHSAEVGTEVIERGVRELLRQYDRVHGGFGSAPKFPHPTGLEVCLRHWWNTRDSARVDTQALRAVEHTLQAMAQGGLFDQLGGGFCRYSVDDAWTIPHFEKMLYDNAQLLTLYSDAWLATRNDLLRQTAIETGEWVIREMQSSDGGYYSTLDADSEGEEGRFYVWTEDQLRGALTDAEWAAVEVRYGLRGQPNFEGRWHLNVCDSVDAVAQRCGVSREQAAELLAAARRKLFTVREQRVRPARDEKVLTSWNGLMIKAMARAGRILRRADFINSAEHALQHMRSTLWRDGRLFATSKDGRTHLNAYLDDYVFAMDAVLELLQARWSGEELEFAVDLAEVVLAHFQDHAQGGFYFTSDDHEKLLHRHKPASDDATPSGNGVAALVLLRLGHILGEHRYLDAAERALRSMSASIERFPSAHGALLIALDEHLHSTETVILRGDPAEMTRWRDPCLAEYAPRRVALGVPINAGPLPGMLADRVPRGIGVTAYICQGHACSAPIETLAEFETRVRHTES